ncbi:hypothetical protein DFH07DRAFT_775591 [Mycena maculata]|uniref:Uncharacterized protein n=1 Tax=Mycena maculata TaxID=230809 RepID=A0AAD7IRJ3_9AGAR|nr:hypothetical protein DFH07DRAFT_775591 [Mycena maculata]
MSSSRKRSRGASQQDDLPPWECDPKYGIVHSEECSICRPYMSHIKEAKASRSTSIQRAFKDLDNQLDTYFLDGVAEGRRRQLADDKDRLRDLERFRNESIATTSRLRSEVHETGQQLSRVKEQLRLAESECDALRKRLESFSNDKLDISQVERMLLDPRDTEDVEQTAPSHCHAVSAVPPPISQTPEVSSGLSTISQIPIPASTVHIPIPAPKPEVLAHSISNSTLPPRPTVEVIASSGAASLRTAPCFSLSAMQTSRGPQTVRQLQYLMNKAHQPGNDEALAKVKLLCAEAHQTRREEKTEMQRYVLANWRNPEPPSSASASISVSPPPAPLLLPNQALLPPRANNPRMEDSVEVWHAYLTTHQGSWPRGVRHQADGSPHLSDLKASRTVARLRPSIGPSGDTAARTEFMACAVQLFASPGMYRDLLRRNALSVAPVVEYKPYRATHFSITATEVARHFAGSGVSVEEAVAELEPWAQEYQAAVVFPTGSSEPRHSKHYSKPAGFYRSRHTRQYDATEDRFGWR